MQKRFASVTQVNGDAIPGAVVTVTNYPSGTTALIYRTDDATGTAISGARLTTDSHGYYEYYAADGHYSETITGAGVTTLTVNDIQLVTATESALVSLASTSNGLGAALVGLVGSEVGEVATNVSAYLNLNVKGLRKNYGAVGDGVTDDTAAVTKAVTAAIVRGRGTIEVEEGNYKITTPINLANLQSALISIRGVGHGEEIYNTAPTKGANFYGLTGTQAVFETQGSHYVSLEDFGIYSLLADTNRSAIGIFQGRTTVQASCQYHNFKKLYVSLANKTGANGSRGSIALYNIQAEHCIYDHLVLVADTPEFIFDNNALTYVPTTGSLSSVTSCTLNEHRECAFVSLSQNAIELGGLLSTTWLDCYYGTNTGGVNLSVAVSISSAGSNTVRSLFFIGGQVENWDSFLQIGPATIGPIAIDTTFADVDAVGPVIRIDVANGQAVYGLNARFSNPTAITKSLIGVGASSGATLYGGHLVLENGITLNESKLTVLGAVVEDLNTSASTITVKSASNYTLNNAVGQKVSSLATTNPVTIATGTYTVLASDSGVINNNAGTLTLTLLSAATYPGRLLMVRTIQAQTVVSASSNVVPLAGGAAGTAILAATAGKWALLQSDGTNWQIMSGN